MWAAIAVSGLILALWGLSLFAAAAFWPPHKNGIGFVVGGGFLGVAYSDHETPWFSPVWEFMPCAELATETHYGFQLPDGMWGSGMFGCVCPFWLPLLISTSAAVLLWRSGRRVPEGHCPKCGYDLTGNLSGRCPECGTEIRNPELVPAAG